MASKKVTYDQITKMKTTITKDDKGHVKIEMLPHGTKKSVEKRTKRAS